LTVLHGGRTWRKYEEVPMAKVNDWDTADVEEIVTHREKNPNPVTA